MRGWIVNKAKRDYWRVAGWYDLDDLIQDGYMCYARCHAKYPSDLSRRHFMALVQVSFVNHIHNLAKKKSLCQEQVLSEIAHDGDERPESTADRLLGVEPEEATLGTILSQLPEGLRQLVLKLLDGGSNTPYLRQGRRWETNNEFYCRLAGLDPKEHSIEDEFRQALGLAA